MTGEEPKGELIAPQAQPASLQPEAIERLADRVVTGWTKSQEEQTARHRLSIQADMRDSFLQFWLIIGAMSLLGFIMALGLWFSHPELAEKGLVALFSFLGGIGVGWRSGSARQSLKESE